MNHLLEIGEEFEFLFGYLNSRGTLPYPRVAPPPLGLKIHIKDTARSSVQSFIANNHLTTTKTKQNKILNPNRHKSNVYPHKNYNHPKIAPHPS
jgi:hypothetical protein